jgi:DNA-binding transcriptional LysR family regulator
LEDIILHNIFNPELTMTKLHTTLPGLISAVQAADSGSFTAAAQALDLTPAAVSKNVAALEAVLQLRLFNRTTRQLSLTEEGRAFITQARAGLALLQAASTQATQGQAPQGLVRLNCSVGFGRSFVLPTLPGFYAQHPQVQVELSLNDQAVDLVREGFDVGIRGGSQPPEGMVARKICDVPSVLVATPRYLKQRGVPRHFSDLAAHDLLRVKLHSGRMLPWLFKESGGGERQQRRQRHTVQVPFEGPARLLISDPALVLDAALLHLGIARVGLHHAHLALQRGQLVQVLPDQQVPNVVSMSIFYPHRAGMAPRVRVLVDHLLAALAKDPALQGKTRP